VSVAVSVQAVAGPPSTVSYRWDVDTEILCATFSNGAPGAMQAEGLTGSVELTGSDASCVILDVRAGSITGVEVAVWPDVRTVPSLAPPISVETARLVVPKRPSQANVALLEVDTNLVADADGAERTIHLRLGASRTVRTLRLAEDVLVDVGDKDRITGLWLLNVPPYPGVT
jgi:hypothetical protein